MPVQSLLVVNNPANWKLSLEGVQVVSARDYLAPEATQRFPGARVFNLCRSYSYQSIGYYVSLLAEARGHRAIPSVTTLRDFRSAPIARSLGEEIDAVIQAGLKGVEGREYSLAVYFGQSLIPCFGKLASQLYRLFPAPLLRAQFVRTSTRRKEGKAPGGAPAGSVSSLSEERWTLSIVTPMSLNSVPEEERDRIAQFAQSYFKKRRQPPPLRQRFVYDLALLVNAGEASPPSNEKALKRFSEAAREMGFYVETITTEDADRLLEFDALFIRETTRVDHPTYRISRLAHAEGLVVLDDPWSILRAANKIYLAESLSRAKIPTPATIILMREDLQPDRLARVPLPSVLKLPEGAFSKGVIKVNTREELEASLQKMLKESDLIIAQEFTPSDFDWRIGVLDHQPLFACKYYMAAGHWQIYNWSAQDTKRFFGRAETLHVELAPPQVVDWACRAARLMGDGLYGVDLKQIGDRVMVIEVNDNPNIDAGIEDAALGMELYRRVARSLRRRIELSRQ